MSLPLWIFYAENELPKEGDLFTVEKIEHGLYDRDSGEHVTALTMRKVSFANRIQIVQASQLRLVDDEP